MAPLAESNRYPKQMKTRKRIDRFTEDAVVRFAGWIADSDWRGKERDCINIFATNFILPAICPAAAIKNYSQIRIECGVPQPSCFNRPSCSKDLVIWRNPLDVAWDANWMPVNVPWVVMEWKTRRKGRFDSMFDDHDIHWLTEFSLQNPDSFGYAVTVDFRKTTRTVHCAKVARGCVRVKRSLARRDVG